MRLEAAAEELREVGPTNEASGPLDTVGGAGRASVARQLIGAGHVRSVLASYGGRRRGQSQTGRRERFELTFCPRSTSAAEALQRLPRLDPAAPRRQLAVAKSSTFYRFPSPPPCARLRTSGSVRHGLLSSR